MTLITNEIYIKDHKKDSYIVASADRRITHHMSNFKKYSSAKKLFAITHLNACVSYWGNTRIKNENSTFSTLSCWLPNFIRKNHDIPTLQEFAIKLQKSVNKQMLCDDLRKYSSGFHLSGFDSNNNPEFIHFSNCGWNADEVKYENVGFKYNEPFADFGDRDFRQFFTNTSIDWNNLENTGVQTYRNGDFKIHEAVWKKIDQAFAEVEKHNNFQRILSQDNKTLIQNYKFKLDLIGNIYKKWGTVKNVAGPFDVIILNPKE